MSAASEPAHVDALLRVPDLVHGFGRRRATPETRQQSRERVGLELGNAGRVLFLKQVHGARVCRAPWEGTPEADAAVATAPRLLLAIETADCLPVLVVDPERRLVGAAHAGWRGSLAGVLRELLRALVAAGSDPRRLLAALGPAIGPCCYEVGDELRSAFGPAGAHFFSAGVGGRPHLDLRGVNRSQLVEAGVQPGRIFAIDECTACSPERYHSYRRDGVGAGRMTSYIGFAAAP
jgi:YfiH family protein